MGTEARLRALRAGGPSDAPPPSSGWPQIGSSHGVGSRSTERWRQPARRLRVFFLVQIGEDLVDQCPIFDAGDDPKRAAGAHGAGLNVDLEHPLQAPRRRHRGPGLGWCLVLRGIRGLRLVAIAPFGRAHQRTVLAVRSEHAVVARPCTDYCFAAYQRRNWIAGRRPREPRAWLDWRRQHGVLEHARQPRHA